MVGRKTLLIITDTHNPQMLEDPELYREAPQWWSSTITAKWWIISITRLSSTTNLMLPPPPRWWRELVQYMGGDRLTRIEAEALLAGIMLDTRGFVMKAGARTFEAAAYLRRLGADTVEVKRLFAESMDTYREKSRHHLPGGAIPQNGYCLLW